MPTASVFIIVGVFIAGLLSGALFITWILRRRKPALQTTIPVSPTQAVSQVKADRLVFRLSYVITPVLLCIASLVTAVVFTFYLPARLAFRFDQNGSPVIYMSKPLFVMLMVTAQILCAVAAWGIAEIVVRMGKSAFLTSPPQFKLDNMVFLMCNMILLPQVILAYIMLDVFIYGVWTRHLISLGIFSILTLAFGSIVIITMLTRVLSQARSATGNNKER
jgi:uncharacterized membrane protein